MTKAIITKLIKSFRNIPYFKITGAPLLDSPIVALKSF